MVIWLSADSRFGGLSVVHIMQIKTIIMFQGVLLCQV
jgi:hypothetical protein